jgi:hypothetical protein
MHTMNTFLPSGRLSLIGCALCLALGSTPLSWAQAPASKNKGKEPITLNLSLIHI